MNIQIPLYAQQKPNSCALACLRMVLGSFGTYVEEPELEAEAHLEKRGASLDELERLARQFGLVAQVRETSIEDLRQILAEGHIAMAYLDRALFDMPPRRRLKHSIRDARVHVVIPSRVTARSVTFHDPLIPRITRKSIRLFQQAHELLGSYSVVCARTHEMPSESF
jgi:predicted double-glycine peptidase